MIRAQGFTLLELLVVLAIAGLMISIAMPFGVRTISNTALRADARELAIMLRSVRQRAIDGQETISVVSLPVGISDAAANGIRRRARVVLADGGNPVIFYPDGTSSGGALRIIEDGRSLDVRVAWLSGAVSVGSTP